MWNWETLDQSYRSVNSKKKLDMRRNFWKEYKLFIKAKEKETV